MKLKYKIILLFFTLLLFLNYYISIYILKKIIQDLKSLNIVIYSLNITESINLILTLTIILTLFILLPIISIWVYNYLKDGLYKNERKILKLLIIPYLLFIIGFILGYYINIYYIIPSLLKYNILLGIDNYINLSSILNFIIIFSLLISFIFQIPLIIKILIKSTLVNKEIIKKYEIPFVCIFTLLTMILTPSGDLLSISIINIPAYFLYKIGIIIS